jgi:hypothetical protein
MASMPSTGRNIEPLASDYGALRLSLAATGYSWQYINTARAILDSGSGTCHPDTADPPAGNSLYSYDWSVPGWDRVAGGLGHLAGLRDR